MIAVVCSYRYFGDNGTCWGEELIEAETAEELVNLAADFASRHAEELTANRVYGYGDDVGLIKLIDEAVVRRFKTDKIDRDIEALNSSIKGNQGWLINMLDEKTRREKSISHAYARIEALKLEKEQIK